MTRCVDRLRELNVAFAIRGETDRFRERARVGRVLLHRAPSELAELGDGVSGEELAPPYTV